MMDFTEREEESSTLRVLYLSHSGKRKHVGKLLILFIALYTLIASISKG